MEFTIAEERKTLDRILLGEMALGICHNGLALLLLCSACIGGEGLGIRSQILACLIDAILFSPRFFLNW